ncbi:MAG TPA: hypothetical protein DCQ88_09035, partial [Acidimicrobiaceae bacterium]|nr:hypothetical protein [Acidimicrobiaceae bacterium]
MMIELLAATTSSLTSIPLGITQEGNWFLQNAWLIPLIPALSFVGILFFGKRLPRGGSELGIAALLAVFLLSICTGFAWMDHRDNFHGEEISQTIINGEHGEHG